MTKFTALLLLLLSSVGAQENMTEPGDDMEIPMGGNTTDMMGNETMEEDASILGVLAGEDDLSVLSNAVQLSDFKEVLRTGEYTAFCPTNEALTANLDLKLLQPNWRPHLDYLLMYHVIPGSVLSTNITEGVVLQSLIDDEQVYYANVSGMSVSINTAVSFEEVNVTEADLVADNGVIHKIDGVLMPFRLTQSLLNIGQSIEGFDRVGNLVAQAGIEDELDAPERTIFAPSKFTDLPPELFGRLNNEPELVALILRHHIVDGVHPLALLDDGMELTNLLGHTVAIGRSEEGIVTVGGLSEIIEPDNVASNGLAHVLSTVLLPPELAGGEGDDNEVEDDDDEEEATSNGIVIGSSGLLSLLWVFVV